MWNFLLLQAELPDASIWIRLIDAGISVFIMAIALVFMWRYFNKALDEKNTFIKEQAQRLENLNSKYIKDSQDNLTTMMEVNKIMDKVLENQTYQKGELLEAIKVSTNTVKEHINLKIETINNKLNAK